MKIYSCDTWIAAIHAVNMKISAQTMSESELLAAIFSIVPKPPPEQGGASFRLMRPTVTWYVSAWYCQVYFNYFFFIPLCLKTLNKGQVKMDYKDVEEINKANLRDLIVSTGLVIFLKLNWNHWFFIPCDLEIWWMTSKNNRAPLP